MIRLFVTEKPSVARDLGQVLNATRRRGDHLEGSREWVAWCLGHLVEICEPHEHDPRWKRWDPTQLPMLPDRLKLRPIRKTQTQFKGLATLLNDGRVSEIVNACDAGREGELIFRYVYELARCRKPVRRLWLSSMTPQAIRAALQRIAAGESYEPLAQAARCRAEADWLVGMNATRGLTSRGGTLLSVGRVQTPTLAMVVNREREIEHFVPEAYWEVAAKLEAQAGQWEARWVPPKEAPADPSAQPARSPAGPPKPGRLPTADAAQAIVDEIRGQPGQVTDVQRKTQRVPPPQLHHLTSLQQEANRRFGMTAKQTLDAAQKLYERHKLLTYPRTDSRHMTRDVAQTLPAVVQAVSTGPYAAYGRKLLERGLPRLGNRYVDDGKVGDHHALLPTDKVPVPEKLGRDEARIYDLVVRQLLGALSPPAVYARTLIEATVARHRLIAQGSVRLEAGWEAINPPASARPSAARRKSDSETARPEEPRLPPVEKGDAVRAKDARSERKETRPPPRFSEASLLGAMERAGRGLDEPELRAAMRECGMGTPATRAATIEMLIHRGYVRREKKILRPEPLGSALISALPVQALKSPRLTGEWESRLAAIADGQEDPRAFRRDIRRFTTDVVTALRQAPRVHVPAPPSVRPNPRRSRATPQAGRAGRQRPPFRRGSSQTESSPSPSREAPRSSRTSRAPSAPPTKVNASRVSAGDGHPRCPKCQQGGIIRGNRGWGCNRWRQGCHLVVWFSHENVAIPQEEADRLFRKGETRLFAVHPQTGRKARLVLDLDAAGNVRWEETKRGGHKRR